MSERKFPCHSLPREQRCDRAGPGGFMGHTCEKRERPFINVRIPIEDAARQAIEQQVRQMFGDLESISRQVFAARENLESFAHTAFIRPTATIETAPSIGPAVRIEEACGDAQIEVWIALLEADFPKCMPDLLARLTGMRDCLRELQARRAAAIGGQA